MDPNPGGAHLAWGPRFLGVEPSGRGPLYSHPGDQRTRPCRHRGGSRGNLPPMEFANLTLIFVTAWLVWKKPGRESLAFALLVTSALLTAFLFFLGTRSSILPPVNY